MGASTKTACRRGILCWAPLFGVTKLYICIALEGKAFQRNTLQSILPGVEVGSQEKDLFFFLLLG